MQDALANILGLVVAIGLSILAYILLTSKDIAKALREYSKTVSLFRLFTVGISALSVFGLLTWISGRLFYITYIEVLRGTSTIALESTALGTKSLPPGDYSSYTLLMIAGAAFTLFGGLLLKLAVSGLVGLSKRWRK